MVPVILQSFLWHKMYVESKEAASAVRWTPVWLVYLLKGFVRSLDGRDPALTSEADVLLCWSQSLQAAPCVLLYTRYVRWG